MEQYVTLETAKLLKEKGFDVPCRAIYALDLKRELEIYKSSVAFSNTDIETKYLEVAICTCPTQQMAMRWLREVYGLHIQALCPVVDVDCDTLGIVYNVVISNLRNYCLAFDTPLEDVEYNTYEEACENAIKYCLTELIK